MECGCISRASADGWVAILTKDKEGVESVGIFCPRCAALEFDHRIEEGSEYT